MACNPLALRLLAALSFALLCSAPHASAVTATLLAKDNQVDIAQGRGAWSRASVGQSLGLGDRIRTGEESRASVQMSDGSVLQLDELTTIEIKSPKESGSLATVNLPGGSAFFFNKGTSGEVTIETPSANGAIRGTAFVLTVNRADGGTSVAMIEGAFELSSVAGRVTAREREQAQAGAAQAPTKGALSDLGDAAPWYLVLENNLSTLQTLREASRQEFFEALPQATRTWRDIAPQLAGAAAIARKPWAKDILRASFAAVGADCGMRARILRSVMAAVPEQASGLLELASELAPECARAFGNDGRSEYEGGEGNYGDAPGNQNPPPGTLGGGAGQGNVLAICHNGRTIFVSPRGAEAHLRNHPGDRLGACQVTPITNP
jgi:hypothetical protein